MYIYFICDCWLSGRYGVANYMYGFKQNHVRRTYSDFLAVVCRQNTQRECEHQIELLELYAQ